VGDNISQVNLAYRLGISAPTLLRYLALAFSVLCGVDLTGRSVL
jgi:hypothetical protein